MLHRRCIPHLFLKYMSPNIFTGRAIVLCLYITFCNILTFCELPWTKTSMILLLWTRNYRLYRFLNHQLPDFSFQNILSFLYKKIVFLYGKQCMHSYLFANNIMVCAQFSRFTYLNSFCYQNCKCLACQTQVASGVCSQRSSTTNWMNW